MTETIFNSKKIWDGLGNSISGAVSSSEAIIRAGLNWKVTPEPIQVVGGNQIPNAYANVRSSDHSVLGITTDRYKIVQNEEAFSFTDYLIGEGVTYETAGSLSSGKRVWMLAKTDTIKILNENITPYIVFTNSFDGKGAVKVALTPIRVICQNTLTMALSTAKRVWSTKHTGDIAAKIEEARETLALATAYTNEMNEAIENASQIKIDNGDVINFANKAFPIVKGMTDRQIKNTKSRIEGFLSLYNTKDDISPFKNTAYGAVLAASDFESHEQGLRQTKTAQENKFMSIVDTSPLMEMVSKYFNLTKAS